MCGIFGGIGNNVNVGIIRALAIANRERGKQSMGLFDSNGKAIKAGIDPYKALAHAEFSAFINTADRWFLAGHTRHATHGKINDTNAHPFRYGNIIGSHNGIVSAPKDYAVDSEYLIDQLNKHGGDYQTALADVQGYWGLSWFDGSAFYLQAHSNEIAIGLADDDNYYYSSDAEHLAACIGTADKICTLSKGKTIRFNDGISSPVMMPDFVSTCTIEYDRWSWRQGYNVLGNSASSAGAVGFAASEGAYNARQLPQHYRESKQERKRRKREARRAQREGNDSGRISHDEFDMANVMAEEAGYRDLGDFMWQEDCETEREAVSMIEKMLRATYPGSDLWAHDDERADVAGLDSITF